MIYKYNPETLTYNKLNYKALLVVFIVVTGLMSLLTIWFIRNIQQTVFISEETRAIILREADRDNEFSPEKLKAYILELNIRYPHIVMAQAQIETGNFTSHIFKENSNLFGMKVATKRPTTNKGEEHGHAFYNSWKESVVDYAFYSAQYLSNIKTEKEYLEYLSKSYAEDPEYVNKIKKIISK